MPDTSIRWVDSHCHLFAGADPVHVLLDRATSEGVEWLMCPGIDLETSLQSRLIDR